MQVLEHQREALAEIVSRAHAFYRGDWSELPIQPRWASLVVGPTGTGKTAVAAMAAEAVNASMLRVSAPSWMPAGAHNRATKETINVIAAHVDMHDRTILVADELDKLIAGPGGTDVGSGGSVGAWQCYVRAEVFDLLDGRWPTGIKDGDGDDMSAAAIESLTTKLRETVFVVGIGTFQAWHDSVGTHRTMGFKAEVHPEKSEMSADIVAEQMPRELANRFNSALIRLPELQANDYHRIANEAAAKLPLRMREAFLTEVAKRLPGAIATKKGVRILEEAMMEVLKKLTPEPSPTITMMGEIITQSAPYLDLCTQ